MAQLISVFEYDSLCMSDTLLAVARTTNAAQRVIESRFQERLAEELDCSYDEEEITEDWREDLIERGVPSDVANTLTPPASVFEEARENARSRVRERYTYRHGTVALID